MQNTEYIVSLGNRVTPQIVSGWSAFMLMLPKIVGSFIVFTVGWFIASGVGSFINEALDRLGLNKALKKTEWEKALKRAKIKVNLSEFLGRVTRWSLVLVVLWLSIDVLGLRELALILEGVVGLLPSIFVAVVMFAVAVIVSDVLEKFVVAVLEKSSISYAGLAGVAVKWGVIGFAISAILIQFGIAKELILIIFSGVVLALSLAFGLAFGLGGKDIAKSVLKDLKKSLK